jgi:hypothetical protein
VVRIDDEASKPLRLEHIAGLICLCTASFAIAICVVTCEIYFGNTRKKNMSDHNERNMERLRDALKLIEREADVVQYVNDSSIHMHILLDDGYYADFIVTTR